MTSVPDIMPKLEDFLAAGAAAAGSMLMSGMGSPQGSAMEQLGAQLVGKLAAGYFSISDVASSEALGVQERDVLTGALRAGYSLSQKRKNQRVAFDGLKGAVCSAAGRQLKAYLTPTV